MKRISSRDIIYVSQMGGVWRLSRQNFGRLVSLGINGQDYNLDELGKMIASDVLEVTDSTSEQWKELAVQYGIKI